MRATGIVRRVDELGRIVIPKEIRHVMRIRDGDPLEIFLNTDNEVVFKKYSPLGAIGDIADAFAQSIHRSTGYITLVCDVDSIVAVAGTSKPKLLEKALTDEMCSAFSSRRTFYTDPSIVSTPAIPITKDADMCHAQIVIPILANGEVIGGIILVGMNSGVRVGDADVKVAEVSANILGRQMEV